MYVQVFSCKFMIMLIYVTLQCCMVMYLQAMVQGVSLSMEGSFLVSFILLLCRFVGVPHMRKWVFSVSNQPVCYTGRPEV